MRLPPITAIISPRTTYAIAILAPNILISKIRLPKSTIGDDIKNEKLTPIGNPALVKPMNMGIEEHEQKGVTVPSKADMIFAPNPSKRPRIFLLLSGGK